MTTPKISNTINENGYSFAEAAAVRRAPAKGGFGYYRADKEDMSFPLSLSWNMTQLEYSDFVTFYRETLVRGSLPFYIDLLVNNNTLTEHQAQFTSEGFKISTVNAHTITVTASLEVVPIDIDETADGVIIAAWEATH